MVCEYNTLLRYMWLGQDLGETISNDSAPTAQNTVTLLAPDTNNSNIEKLE